LVESGGSVLLDVSISDSFTGYAVVGPEHSAVLTAVILTAPDGTPIGENPIFVPGTNLVALDLVVFNIQFEPLSNGWLYEVAIATGSSLEQFVPLYDDFATLIEATGSLQDLTLPLRSYEAGWGVQAQSFLIPEPGTGALLTLGLAVLAAGSRMRLQGRASPGRASPGRG
jgi:hypothetical protein